MNMLHNNPCRGTPSFHFIFQATLVVSIVPITAILTAKPGRHLEVWLMASCSYQLHHGLAEGFIKDNLMIVFSAI
jgi:hypothetical protein